MKATICKQVINSIQFTGTSFLGRIFSLKQFAKLASSFHVCRTILLAAPNCYGPHCRKWYCFLVRKFILALVMICGCVCGAV